MHGIDRIGEFQEFDIFWSFGKTTPELRAKILRFWADNGAIPDPCVAWRRTFEVGCVVVNKKEEIVGVNSIYADRLPFDGRFYWFYRAFTRPDSRMNGLSSRIFHLAYDRLIRSYAAEPGSPSGIVMIFENTKLDTEAGTRIMQRGGLERLGTDPQGRSVWRKCFPDIIAPPHS